MLRLPFIPANGKTAIANEITLLLQLISNLIHPHSSGKSAPLPKPSLLVRGHKFDICNNSSARRRSSCRKVFGNRAFRSRSRRILSNKVRCVTVGHGMITYVPTSHAQLNAY